MPRRARTIQAKRRISPGLDGYRPEKGGGGPGNKGVSALSTDEKMK
jgi:hypothetical protein